MALLDLDFSHNTCPCFSISFPQYLSLILLLFAGLPWTFPVSYTMHKRLLRLPLRMEYRHGIRNQCCAWSGILFLLWNVPSVRIHGACSITSSTHLHWRVISILYISELIVGPKFTKKRAFVLFDILLVADTSNHPDFLTGECFSTLFEDISVSNVEWVKDSISVDSENFFFLHFDNWKGCL